MTVSTNAQAAVIKKKFIGPFLTNQIREFNSAVLHGQK